eukprot:297814-Amorphochlora_amoeboformis.AAC.1
MTGILQHISTSLIVYKDQRYLIMDAPTDANLDQYLKVWHPDHITFSRQELKSKGVTTLVRTCEPTYSVKKLEQAGIPVQELPFADGAPPPNEIVTKWLSIVKDVFESKGNKATIAIHCVAGLGRAPVCVAIGLIEKGMDAMDAIQMIRNKRRGAINRKQVDFLVKYKRRGNGDTTCCVVM